MKPGNLMKGICFIIMVVPYFSLAQETNSIDFLNTEKGNHIATDGLIYYDLNFYTDHPEVTGNDGGGLSIYSSEDGWGAVFDTNNMQWITPTFNGGVFNANVGIGTSSPSTLLHLHSGGGTLPVFDPGTKFTITSTANSGAYVGASIIGGNTTGASILNFGDKDDENIGRIFYSHSDNSMKFRVTYKSWGVNLNFGIKS